MIEYFKCQEYLWHPLFGHVLDTMKSYYMILREVFYNQEDKNTQEQCQKLYSVDNFNDILGFLRDCYEGKYTTSYQNHAPLKQLLDIFYPLEINCHQGLALFKYKNLALLGELGYDTEFWSLHNGLYRECRSIVIDIPNLCIVLAPQAKFFNVNENEEWSYNSIKNKIEQARLVEITNKLDGSNQNYRWYNGAIVGSGSSAINVEESWRLKRGYSLLTPAHENMMRDYSQYTFMYEFISPENQVVVNYTKEQEGLYLFGMRDVYTGDELTYSAVLKIAAKYGVPTTEMYQTSFDSIMNQLDDYSSDEKEGWVIRIVDVNNDFFKAKLKINDYVLMHKAVSKLISPNAIIRAIADGKWDDFYSKIPAAYKENAIKIKTKVIDYIAFSRNKLDNYYQKAVLELRDNIIDRKTYVQWYKINVPKKYHGYMVALYEGRSINFLTKNINGYKKLNELIIEEEEVK